MITLTIPVSSLLFAVMVVFWVLFIIGDVVDKRWLRNASFVTMTVTLFFATCAILGMTGAES